MATEAVAPIKQLLRSLGEGAGELELYKKYLEENVHSSTDLGVVSGLSDDMLKVFYGCEADEPRFMSFKNGSDLGSVSAILSTPLVIYYTDTLGRNPRKYYDSRLLCALVMDSGWEDCQRKSVYFELIPSSGGKGRHPRLTRLDTAMKPLAYDSRLSEKNFIGNSVSEVSQQNGCFARTLLAVLKLDAETVPPPVRACGNLTDLFVTLSDMERAWPELERHLLAANEKLVIACHLGCLAVTKSPYTPAKQRYNVLCMAPIAANHEGQQRVMTPRVVMVCFPTTFYLPRPEAAKAVIACSGQSAGGSNPLQIKPPTSGCERPSSSDSFYETRPPCPCELCVESVSYNKNFSRRQAQKPPRHDLDMAEYMKMFNIFTEDNHQRFLEAIRLSLACVDVEAVTIDMPGRTNDRIKDVDRLTRIRVSSAPRKVQQIAVFASLDCLGDMETPKYFRVTEERKVARVAEDYLRYLKERRELASSKKRELLMPILSVLAPLREAHMSFCQAKGVGPAAAKAAYKSSLSGRFETHVEKLISRFVIFTYYGTGYDHVILSPHLAVAAKNLEPPGRLSMQRVGNKVRSMCLKGPGLTGIKFRDICHLLDKSFSLDKFARMTGLPETKSRFPFTQIDSLASLDKPELSWDRKDWVSDLTGEAPTEEQIGEVKNVFVREKCRSVYDFLVFYLRLDVVLLLKAAAKLFESFYALLGTHPVDIGCYTIASYAYHAAQLNLFKTKRMAMYSPRVAPIYAAMQQATVGGLVQLSRHSCTAKDVDVDDCDSGINAHLWKWNKPERRGKEDAREPPLPQIEKLLETVRLQKDPLPSWRAATTPREPRLSTNRFSEASFAALMAAEEKSVARDAVSTVEELRKTEPVKGSRLAYLDVTGMYAGASKCQRSKRNRVIFC